MAVALIRTSERGDFKSCQFLWYHSWVNGLRTPRNPTWSWFGTAIHKALEVRYPVGTKRGSLGDVLAAFEAAVGEEEGRIWEQSEDMDEEVFYDSKELGIAMLKGYVRHWGEDRHWQVLHTEQPFQIDVRHPETGRLIAVYCGTWDAFIWDSVDKVYRLVDHKTRAQFKKDWSFFDLNDQAGSYLWVAPEVLRHMGLLGKKDTIDGIIFNMLRKAMPQQTAADGIVYNLPKKDDFLAKLPADQVTPKMTLVKMAQLAKDLRIDVKGKPRAKQPSPLFERYKTDRGMEQRVNQGKKVLDEARHMDLVRRGKLPLLKHPTEDCVRCPLFDFCQLDELDPAEAQAYAATMLTKTDPYRDHREAMQANGFEVTGS
jgi:PD-(D/E)XK nuclease superfamily protein